MQKTLSADDLARSLITVGRGSKLQPTAFLRRLSTLGYHQTSLVEQRGQVSRRGGILDVYPATASLPTRIELVGDTVESLRQFDPGNQLSLTSSDSVTVSPAREAILTPERTKALETGLAMDNCTPSVRGRFEEELLQLGATHGFRDDYFYVPFLATSSLIDHLPQGSLLILEEGSDLETAVRELDQEAETIRREAESRGDLPYGLPQPDFSWPEIEAKIEGRHRRLSLSRWAGQEKSSTEYRLPFRSPRAYGGQIGALVDETAYQQKGQRLLVSHQAQRLGELLSQRGREVKATTGIGENPPRLALVDGSLPEGWHLQDGAVELSLLTDREIFGFVKQRRSRPQRRGPSRKSFLAELSPGDYVIHVEHGVGRFASLTTMKVETREREYLELHYADGDRLFVPTDQLDRLSRYVGPDGREPRLTRLNSGEWQRTKRRVQRAVEELAEELVSLYAARQVLPGHPHSHDTPWQAELEASFPYLETDDQLAAMTAVKEDMERPGPMDRLVSGDVGYGKTEVAVRAAFKSVMDGKQVAMLVPTTVLAQQHFQTFKERLAAFAPRIEMLSRFRTEAEQRLVIEGMAAGGVDIVIGTHRLLQKDVRFKDLGLFIVDEEQRFGVAHKEYLKKMRQEVDVLTLSATPIPRTLYMALGGIRDMSTIETPPEDRLPIKTYVSEFNESLVREAIVRELERGGQVYFVHNRVRSIDSIARRVEEAVP
ncbi:MAG: DEAD/DEAH box helicase, partial [Dehalococcoidia bacterium]|nr:DEAD/DEAH box helicase [Dehalococcoidia bacterium]